MIDLAIGFLIGLGAMSPIIWAHGFTTGIEKATGKKCVFVIGRKKRA